MLSEVTGLRESPSSQGPGSGEHSVRPGSGLHVGPAKPELLQGTIVLRCLSDQHCKEPGAWVGFGKELPRILWSFLS